MRFQIQTESFEGPIDALLQMIEKRKLAISDVSLSDITDDYLRFVQNLSYQQNLSNITHFIMVAAILTLIKSKSILPSIDLTEEEEGDIEGLKKRLELLALYKDMANILKDKYTKKRYSFYSRAPKRDVVFEPAGNINKTSLSQAFSDVIALVPKKTNTEKEASMKISIHIEELMNSLEDRMKKGVVNFNQFIKNFSHEKKHDKEIRTYQVVGFLAMLEMVKNGVLEVMQKQNFESIHMSSSSIMNK